MKAAFAAILLGMVLAISACSPEKAQVHLTVQAKTNLGDPVAEALLFIDDEQIGVTDELGKFHGTIAMNTETNRRFQVRKESDIYYFAPYFENIIVQKLAEQSVDIEAKLYFVPKPGKEGDAKVNQGLAASEPVNSEVAETKEVAIDPKPIEEDASQDRVETDGAPQEALQEEDLLASKQAQEVDTVRVENPEADDPGVNPEPDLETDLVAATESATGVDSTEELAAEAEAAKAVDDVAQEIKDPDPAPVVLTPIDDSVAGEVDKLGKAYPKPRAQGRGMTIYTVHVYSGGKPISGAEVLMGDKQTGDLKVACHTNDRGRCAIRFPVAPVKALTFVAKRLGFQTMSQVQRVRHKGTLRFNLLPGKTLDIFAITKAFNYTRGLSDVDVFVEGQLVGGTDEYGHLAYVYSGKDDDLIKIALKPKSHLPEIFETDFVVGKQMTLVRYFTPRTPPPVRMTLLRAQPAGKVGTDAVGIFNGEFDQSLRSAALQHIFAPGAFQEYPRSSFERDIQKSDMALTKVMREGWSKDDLKASVDAILVPTLVVAEQPTLELSVIDSKGKVIAAAKERLKSISDAAGLGIAVKSLAEKITRAFPFEGAVLNKSSDQIEINLGYNSGRGVKVGDKLKVYGIQLDKRGMSQVHRRIGDAEVVEVSDANARAKVTKLEPRSTVERGDLIVLDNRKAPQLKRFNVAVVGNVNGVKGEPVTQANIYFNDAWVGAADDDGVVTLDGDGASGKLKVIKHGYRPHEQQVSLVAGKKVTVELRRETAFLRIDSQPSGATVKIEGKAIGKTPVAAPVPVPSGFVKLEIEGPVGYKSFSQVLELDSGTLDLTGPNAVALEKDLRLSAQKLLDTGRVDQAVARLREIPQEHSDYLLARHELGEIYLTMLGKPDLAVKAFEEVTANAEVEGFNDKRFIGSHINKGIALFLQAENFSKAGDEASAKKAYAESIQVLDKVTPQLRFVPQDQYAQAVHNVAFHKALIRHRLWKQTQDIGLLNETVKAWDQYLSGSAVSLPVDEDSSHYIENAKVYQRQAQTQLAKASPAEVDQQ